MYWSIRAVSIAFLALTITACSPSAEDVCEAMSDALTADVESPAQKANLSLDIDACSASMEPLEALPNWDEIANCIIEDANKPYAEQRDCERI